MYQILLTISNPQTGASKQLHFQFEPSLMVQAKWNGAFPTVRTQIDELVTESTPKEPPTW